MTTSLWDEIFKAEGDWGYTINPSLSLNDIKIYLNERGLEEDANWNKLAWALLHKSKIERLYRENARNAVPLEKYMKAHKYAVQIDGESESGQRPHSKAVGESAVFDNNFKVLYNQTTGKLCGRMQASGSISMQGMVREVRHLIASDNYVDVDMVNAHPIITEWICDNLGIDCEMLKRYIRERESLFEQINNYSVENGGRELSRGYLKVYMLKISYGCGDGAINKIGDKQRHPFIDEYVKCMRAIGGKVMARFKSFHELNVARRVKNGKNYNLVGSSMSHLCQYVENQILMKMYSIHPALHESRKSILCFDGIMIHKDVFSVDFNKDTFIQLCETHMRDKGFQLFKLEVKEMEYGNVLLGELAKSGIEYKEEKDYVTEWFNMDAYIRFAQLKEYEQLFLNANFNTVLTEEQKEILNEEVGGGYAADFRKKLESRRWNVGELLLFYKSFGHLFYAKLETDNSKFLIHLNKKGYNMGDLPNANVTTLACVRTSFAGGERFDIKPTTMSIQMMLTKKYPSLVKKYDRFVFTPYTSFQSSVLGLNIEERDFNIFSGYEINRAGEWLGEDEVDMSQVEPWLYHLKEVLCAGSEESFQFMLRWCQIVFREPRTRTKSIPVFVSEGEQVGGKGTFFNELLGKLILGEKLYGFEDGLDFLAKSFNPQLEGRLLTVCEEATTADGSFHSLHAKLKSQSTESTISINEKNIRAKVVDNYNNFVILSNYDNCVKIEDDEKRFVLFKTSVSALNKKGGAVEYFNWLYKYMNKKSALHFYYYIYHMDLSHVSMNVKPRNSFYNEMKEATASNQVKFARDVIAYVKEVLAKKDPLQKDLQQDDDPNEVGPDDCYWMVKLEDDAKFRKTQNNYYISIQKLYHIYRLWCQDEGIKKPVEKKGAFTTDLQKYMSIEKPKDTKCFVIYL